MAAKKTFLESASHPGDPMSRIKNIHFVGIGGVGMSGIAEVLLNLGYSVSGSDRANSATTKRLAESGAAIYIGHEAGNIATADVVVVSTAIAEDNPELIAARESRTPIITRAEMLAELMRFRQGIAVAGTHGKTTTTSLIASVLGEAGLDPTFIIGGKLNSIASHGKLGSGHYLVAEADESDASFLYLQPMIVVVTNIDADHLSTYEGDFEKLKSTFLEFIHHTPFYGMTILCIDDEVNRGVMNDIKRPLVTYGFSQDADVQAYDLAQNEGRTTFKIKLNKPYLLDEHGFEIELNLPGQHNALNALAAICIALELGVKPDVIQSSLGSFLGIGRRLQSYGTINTAKGDVLLLDDYGHHPREISATIEAIKKGWKGRRLVVAFQPHRFSRTRDLFDDFCAVLNEADVLLISEVYAAGENLITGADGRSLCAGIRARGELNPVFVEDVEDLPKMLTNIIEANDVVLTLGAGSIGTVAAGLSKALEDE